MRLNLWASIASVIGLSACGGGTSGAPNDDAPAPAVDLSACTSRELPFFVYDAAYSEALGRIVAFDGGRVQLLDPETLESTAIELPESAVANTGSISLSPSGLTAAVAYANSVFVVDLERGQVISNGTTSVMPPDSARDLVVGDGYVYLLAGGEGVDVIEIATGMDRAHTQAAISGEFVKLHPNGKSLYLVGNQILGLALERADTSGATLASPAYASNSTGTTSNAPAGDLWISDDGTQIFTGAGTIHRADPAASDDMTYVASLDQIPGLTRVAAATFTQMALDRSHDRVYAVPNLQDLANSSLPTGVVEVYGYSSHALTEQLVMPCVAHDSKKVDLTGAFVFVPASGARVYVLGDFNPASVWGITSFDRQ
jgi:hypothetical protein